MDQTVIGLSRRNLLAAAAAGGTVAAGGLALSTAQRRQDDAPARAQDREVRGYRLTEHVARYYRTTRT